MSTPTSTPRSSGRASAWVGILLGLALLGLTLAFAIGLPHAYGDKADRAAGESAERTLVLPDERPGGYRAADDIAAFAGGELEDQAQAIADQQRTDREHGDAVLPKVLGTPAVTRTYVADQTQAVFVQVFQSEGGAFAPNTLPDPEAAGGQPSTTMERVGAGVCILTFGSSETGEAPAAPAFSQCQVTDAVLTVQIGSAAVPAEDLVEVADDLLADLQDQ